MKKKGLGLVGLQDIGKAVITAFIMTFLMALSQSLDSGHLPTLAELRTAALVGLGAAISYLIKNLLTNNADQFLKKDAVDPLNKITQALFIVAASALMLSSCYTDNKATAQVQKAIQRKPAIAAKLTRDAFPCTTTKADTATSYKDSTVWFSFDGDQPINDNPVTASELVSIHDTIHMIKKVAVPGKVIRVPVTVRVPTNTITLKVEDSAKIKLLTIQANDKDFLINSLKGRVDRLQRWRMWLSLGLLISVVGNFILLKRK